MSSNQNSLNQDLPASKLQISPAFCPEDVADPFDTVVWDKRVAQIKGDKGELIFEQKDCEVPADWSQLATNIVASKYLFGEAGTPQRETSVRQLVYRVTRTIADWGIEDGYFASKEDGENFYRDLTWLCVHQRAAFNSPVWFNVGLYTQYHIKGAKCNWAWDKKAQKLHQPENSYEFPQGSACFIQSVEDNMESIMDLARSEAMLFKFGSGTGTDLSTVRSCREKLSGGGTPSGPLSFMRVYDQIAAVVKSGGKTRRAAKMQSLKIWHPDIMEFVECKIKEEAKAKILMKNGYDYDAAYSSTMFQNANLSIRLTDDFMKAVEAGTDWTTRWVTDESHPGPTYPARELLNKIAQATWECGDPGVQYDTTINRWHTCPKSGPINASNPCSEYMFIDDSACNLASINLLAFLDPETGLFDVESFQNACRIMLIAQEIIVDRASYPTEKIAQNSHDFRALGLGYSNLGSLLMALGLPYDSDEGRGICGAVTAIMHGTANRTSIELAKAVGPFDRYAENKDSMLEVMQMHWNKVEELTKAPRYLRQAARNVWDEVLANGRRYGFRNAQVTVLAPTGTISFMMDCDTTGIEPEIALIKYKQMAGGGYLKLVNRTVPMALNRLGYSQEDIDAILNYINTEDTIEGAPGLLPEHLPVFDCAFLSQKGTRCISWKAHILMMAAAQPFLSGAISKTVNLPKDATVDDIAKTYIEGWKMGLKAVAVYRDGSKGAQVLSTKKSEEEEVEEKDTTPVKERIVYRPRRERLPDTRESITHKFSIAGHEGYITVGKYPDGRPGEVFITMAKEGSTIGGLMDCFGTAISMSLQYGVPLDVYVNKFSHTRFEPMGHTKNPDIRIAKSIVDYIFRWLGITFLGKPKDGANLSAQEESEALSNGRLMPTHSKDEEDGEECGCANCHCAEKAEGVPAAAETAKTENGGKAAPKATYVEQEERNSFDGPYDTVYTSENGMIETAGGRSESKSSFGKQIAEFYRKRNGSASQPKPEAKSGTAVLEYDEAHAQEAVDSRRQMFSSFQDDAPSCSVCGSIMVRNGSCYLCRNCGSTSGCS